MIASLYRRPTATGAFLILSSIPLVAVATEPAARAKPMGEQWETTSQMSMEGMPMSLPSNTVKVCSPKEWKEAPMSADERRKGKNSDFKKNGAKVTWKTVCAGPPEMSGEGEITRSDANNWTGSIRFTSSEGNMTLKLSGKRVGRCELNQK